MEDLFQIDNINDKVDDLNLLSDRKVYKTVAYSTTSGGAVSGKKMMQAVVNLVVSATLSILQFLSDVWQIHIALPRDGLVPEAGLIVNKLLFQLFGKDKFKKLEYLCQFYHKFGLFKYEGKIYIFDEHLAQTVINKLDKVTDNYADDTPLKDSFLSSSEAMPDSDRVIESIFRKTSIYGRSSLVIRDLDILCKNILEMNESEPINFTKLSLRLALDMAGHVLLELDLGGQEGRQDRLLETMMTILHRCYALEEISSKSKEFAKAVDELDNLTSQILTDAVNTDDNNVKARRLVSQLYDACGYDKAKDNMKVFLMAGTESTASVLPIMFYLLAKYPQVQKELQTEAEQNVDNIRKDPNLPLPKIDSVIKEVLRLYPIVPFIRRQNERPVTIGNFKLKERSEIMVFLWGMHRSPYTWNRSTNFVPFRFYKNLSRKDSSNLYIPFGDGSRMCIAQHLARLEIRLTMAVLLNAFDFRLVKETQDLQFVVDWTHSVIHPDRDMFFRVVPRAMPANA
ncbi:cytochrome P450 3A15-like [Mizuhopecten yessoensis]|uniref:Cytochrome P450 3A28 n=1 Tax=Mizuhopecten yessoensis TaxID=6573 RepID=A0A210PYW6_MIZYE|nr:cytochrome P450 3A15-like [Mizuhopecten yessoensis]OWF41678.1 Cytochrome P450 3A28 [Mizuhopecten yessoensis]